MADFVYVFVIVRCFLAIKGFFFDMSLVPVGPLNISLQRQTVYIFINNHSGDMCNAKGCFLVT